MSMIGVSNTHYAVQTADSALALTYSAPVSLYKTKQIDVKFTPDIVKYYADNALDEVYYGIKDATVDLTLNELLPADAGALLGQTRQSDGMYLNSSTVPPYVAFGYERLKLNQKRRRVWLYKGKFGVSDEQNKSKDETVALDPEKISGTFGYCLYGNQTMRRVLDEDDPLCDPTAFANFFSSVTGSMDVTPPTVTCVPLNNATGVSTGTSIVLTFSEAILQSSIVVGDNFLLEKNDGTVIAGTGAWNSPGTVYTFTPTVALTSAGVYIATVSTGVKDLSGNALAVANTFKFTCA